MNSTIYRIENDVDRNILNLNKSKDKIFLDVVNINLPRRKSLDINASCKKLFFETNNKNFVKTNSERNSFKKDKYNILINFADRFENLTVVDDSIPKVYRYSSNSYVNNTSWENSNLNTPIDSNRLSGYINNLNNMENGNVNYNDNSNTIISGFNNNSGNFNIIKIDPTRNNSTWSNEIRLNSKKGKRYFFYF